MQILLRAVLLLAACSLKIVYAANGEEPAAIPEPPELPAPVQSGEEMQPDITIVKKGGETIQEYRRNGQLYMVKITPVAGPSYFMLDKDGDGVMDVKKNSLDENTHINQWLLFQWDWP